MKLVKNILVIVGAISLFFVAAGFVLGLVSKEEAPVRADAYQQYMDNCDPDRTITNYCGCTFNYLERAVGINGMIRLGNEYNRTGKYSPEMQAAISTCADRL